MEPGVDERCRDQTPRFLGAEAQGRPAGGGATSPQRPVDRELSARWRRADARAGGDLIEHR